MCVGLHIKGALYNAAQIGTGVLQQGIKNMNARTYGEDNGHKKDCQPHVQHGQVLNALIHTRDHRSRRSQSNHSNGDHLNGRAHRYRWPEIIDACIYLRYRQPQRRCQAKHSPQYRERIDDMPSPTMNAITNERVQRRAHRQGKTVPVGEVSQH